MKKLFYFLITITVISFIIGCNINDNNDNNTTTSNIQMPPQPPTLSTNQ